MNDIDRRCDAYLEWLDNKRRNKGPLLKQLADVQGATTTIMGLIDPGSAAAMQIVGQAFGLLRNSIENYHSRLLLEIEPSTRNSVVLTALRETRAQINAVSVSSKPEAEYLLREYLRRCLPFAIESRINDLSTLGAQRISPDSAELIFEAPVLEEGVRRSLESSIPSKGAQSEVKKPPTLPVSKFLTQSVRLTLDEKAMQGDLPAKI